MGNKRRQRKGKQRGMHRKMRTAKKPMSEEQKAERKKIQETDRVRSKADLEKKLKVKK